MKNSFQIEIYKLVRHPLTFGVLSLSLGLLSLLFYRLCVDYLHLAHGALHAREISASISVEIIKPLCSWAILLMALTFPLFTTQSLSQEVKQRTFALWAMSSRTAFNIIFGKWLSILCFVGFIELILLLMIGSLFLNATLNWQMITLSLLTVALIGCCIISFGLFISSLISHPIFALLVTYIGLLLWMLIEWLNPFSKAYAYLAKELSLINHSYAAFHGIINMADFVFFILVSIFWLTLTSRHLAIKMTHVKL
ncbi:MAG: hypothetical protein JSR17_00880 [Proteobacteria bacterium]|nr:hypothetical protein [Pseudomonadota bacterium]